MPFQFLCPQGHLLQGDEAHMGMQTHCPQCGVLFIIPTVPAAQMPVGDGPAESENRWEPRSPQSYLGSLTGGASPAHKQNDPGTAGAPDVAVGPNRSPAVESEPKIDPQSTVLHIPCPNGHELESPLQMLGQEVLCPHCGAQFLLRREDSVEVRQEEELREQRRAEAWLRWSIAAAVIVLAGLLAMIFIAHS
jgi:hypothetical protein